MIRRSASRYFTWVARISQDGPHCPKEHEFNLSKIFSATVSTKMWVRFYRNVCDGKNVLGFNHRVSAKRGKKNTFTQRLCLFVCERKALRFFSHLRSPVLSSCSEPRQSMASLKSHSFTSQISDSSGGSFLSWRRRANTCSEWTLLSVRRLTSFISMRGNIKWS